MHFCLVRKLICKSFGSSWHYWWAKKEEFFNSRFTQIYHNRNAIFEQNFCCQEPHCSLLRSIRHIVFQEDTKRTMIARPSLYYQLRRYSRLINRCVFAIGPTNFRKYYEKLLENDQPSSVKRAKLEIEGGRGIFLSQSLIHSELIFRLLLKITVN